MPKKRPPRKAHFHSPSIVARAGILTPPNLVENDILAFLYQSIAPVSLNDIARELAAKHSEKKTIERSLETLLHENTVRKSGKREFSLSKNALIYEGILEQNPRGFGFVSNRTSMIDAPPLSKDPFIPASPLEISPPGRQGSDPGAATPQR